MEINAGYNPVTSVPARTIERNISAELEPNDVGAMKYMLKRVGYRCRE